MTTHDHTTTAREHRRNGEYATAGDYYTKAAYDGYAKSLPDSPWFGAGLVDLQRAAICYRVAGKPDTCRNRCEQGILIAEDVIDRVFRTDPDYYVDRARRGIWYEHVGDFRTIGGIEDPDAAYDEAIAVYRDGNDPDTFYADQEQMPVMELYRSIAEAAGRDTALIDTMDNDMTFVDWVEHKRETYGDLVEAICERGSWPLPDIGPQ